MDWRHELVASIVWLGETFVVGMIGMTVGILLVARYTVWGRQFGRLTWRYFSPRRTVGPLLWLAAIVFLTLFAVRMDVLFSFWYNGFYTALQKLDIAAFRSMLGVFAVLATIHVLRSLFSAYLREAMLIRWRRWLTDHLMDRWLGHQVYYRSQYVTQDADNPDQRIQQDVATFVSSSLTLLMGLLGAVVSLWAFTVILWGLSGTLALFGIEVPRGMVVAVYVYVIAATVFALKVGRPLIRISFLTEKFNADFRYALIRLREYGESIAFFRGEAVERGALARRFANVIANAWERLYRILKFEGLNLTISQLSTVFPFVVQAPRLFSRQITLGDVMQSAQAFGQVESALSFFRSSYDDFAAYRAVIIRLTGFLDMAEAAQALPGPDTGEQPGVFSIAQLEVTTPTGVPLLHKLDLQLSPGDSLLVRGDSGVGKTTLLRAIAGLWPYATGRVARPEGGRALFLPQKPYLPLGTLRAALYYPAPVPVPADGIGQADDNDEAASVLADCLLAKLVPLLDHEQDWSRILSLGEQQRLAIGRVLLARPQLLFLDEASAAMDESLEHAMYTLIRARLPRSIMISVGHRSSLSQFHAQALQLLGGGRWTVLAETASATAAKAPTS